MATEDNENLLDGEVTKKRPTGRPRKATSGSEAKTTGGNPESDTEQHPETGEPDILERDEDGSPDPTPEPVAEETEKQARIRELRERLAAPPVLPGTPADANVLSEEDVLIQELEDQLAARNNEYIANAAPTEKYLASEDGVFYIHFIADGLTAFGKVWYTGEEIPFDGRNGSAFRQTINRLGESWVDMTEDEQIDRYGKIMFRHGPWRGARFEDEALQKKAEKARRKIPSAF